MEEANRLLRRSRWACDPKTTLSSLCARVVATRNLSHHQHHTNDKTLQRSAVVFCGPFLSTSLSAEHHVFPSPSVQPDPRLANQSLTQRSLRFALVCVLRLLSLVHSLQTAETPFPLFLSGTRLSPSHPPPHLHHHISRLFAFLCVISSRTHVCQSLLIVWPYKAQT